MRLPWQKEKAGGGIRLSRGWRKNIHPRQGRLPDVLAELEREDPEARRYGGAPTFTQAEFLARRPPGRR